MLRHTLTSSLIKEITVVGGQCDQLPIEEVLFDLYRIVRSGQHGQLLGVGIPRQVHGHIATDHAGFAHQLGRRDRNQRRFQIVHLVLQIAGTAPGRRQKDHIRS